MSDKKVIGIIWTIIIVIAVFAIGDALVNGSKEKCSWTGCNNEPLYKKGYCSTHYSILHGSETNLKKSSSSSSKKSSSSSSSSSSKSSSSRSYSTGSKKSNSLNCDPDDYDSAEDYADDAWGDDFDDWDDAYDYWEDNN